MGSEESDSIVFNATQTAYFNSFMNENQKQLKNSENWCQGSEATFNPNTGNHDLNLFSAKEAVSHLNVNYNKSRITYQGSSFWKER